jgi:hypothetical protein
MRFHLVSVHKLVVEMDALYIRGMLNNPDVQPNATINQWIATILLFDFKLIHILAEKHHGPDGLSRREPADGKDDDEDDPEDWINHALALGIWVVSWLDSVLTNESVATWMLDTQDEPPPQCSSCLLAKARANSGTNNANADKNDCNSSQHSDSLEHAADKLPSFPSSDGDANNIDSSNSPQEPSADNLPPLEEDADNNPANDTGTNNDIGDEAIDPSDEAPSPFPQHEKTTKADDELMLIHHYLSDPRPLPHLHSNALTRFLRRAAHFSLADGRLWRMQADGQHQLYVVPSLRFSLIRDAHDNLSHKGVYSTRHTLLNRFWWPSLEGDVKWYIGTCHQCQLHQTMQVCILPTVATPVPLFCKAYIDTMFMPLALGFWYIAQA